MATANLVLRFLLELGGIAAVAVVGYGLAAGTPLGWALAIGAAVLFIAAWGRVVAPKAANGLSQTRKDLIGTALLLGTAAGLALVGRNSLAIGFAALVVLNGIGLAAFGPEARDRLAGAAR